MSKILDNILMMSLGDLFRSKARTEVLRGMCFRAVPVGVRKLARTTGLHPHSVEVALKALLDEGLVERVSLSGTRSGYRIQEGHQMTCRLQAVFLADQEAELRERSSNLEERALALCAFMDEGLNLVMKGRRSLHDADGMP